MRIPSGFIAIVAVTLLMMLPTHAESQRAAAKSAMSPERTGGDNEELMRLFDEEQSDHSPSARKTDEFRLMADRHRARVVRVRGLYAQKKMNTGPDYYRAAVILQRGEEPEDYQLGQQLKAEALKLGWPHFHTGPEQDCRSGIPVCQKTYVQNQSYIGVGNSQEVAAGSCLGAGESNSVWYTFTAQTSGSLTFTINTANDYDFALYNISNAGCAGVPASAAIRCNYSAAKGQTGLTLPASAELPAISVGAGGAPMMSGVNVVAGETYALLVNNFTGDQMGYSLTFDGTASIMDSTPPTYKGFGVMDAANCQIELTMSEPVRCSSIAADGSDFELLTGGGSVITGAMGVNCGAFTNKIRLTYSLNSGDSCNYWPKLWAIRSKTGSDGNTLVDNCGNAMPTGKTAFVQTLPRAVPHLALAGNATSFCKDASIIVNGSSDFADKHFWSIQQSDANGWTPLGPEYSEWFSGPAGTIDMAQFAAQKGLVFECGKFYSIKLAVGNCCTLGARPRN